jgi:integrase
MRKTALRRLVGSGYPLTIGKEAVMSRPSNSIPTLRFHKASGQFYYFAAKKRHYLGSDQAEAERRYRNAVANGLSGTTPGVKASSGSLTLAEALVLYVEHAIPKYASQQPTMFRINRAVDAAIDVHGELNAAAFRGRALRDVRDRLLSETPKLSRRYINHLGKSLKTAFSWLVEQELVPAETLYQLRAVKSLTEGEGGAELEDVPPVEDSVVEATLPFCPPMLRDMIRVQRLLGCRPGELVRLRVDEISTSPKQPISIPRTSRKAAAGVVDGQLVWMAVPSTHKTIRKGKIRLIGIGPDAQAIIQPYMDSATNENPYLFQPARLLTGNRGAKMIRPQLRYSTCSYDRAVGRAIERARKAILRADKDADAETIIPGWAPNQLRKAASEDAAAKTDAESAAAMLGHSASKRATDGYIQTVMSRILATAAKCG